MFDEKTLNEVRDGMAEWWAKVKEAVADAGGRRRFSSVSDQVIKPLYTPEDVRGLDYSETIGFPGAFPFTRGCQPDMYRGRVWTFRMFSGFGSAEDTNRRYHHLLKHGETGLSIAYDYPTLMGYDSDSSRAHAEVGKCGVAIDSLADFEVLMKGIPLGDVTISHTINPPASITWAMNLSVADKQGVPWDRLGGTLQNDMLKEFIAQKTFMLPPEPSVRLVRDIIEFGTLHVPRWNTISISGYHMREAGATAVQELAFTLADGMAYVQDMLEHTSLDVDAFAPRLSFFFNAHIDFFEEIAKMRAARRMWARIMRDRFKARNPRSWWMRFHTQTAGCSLTAQQPLNNVVRVAVQALAAALGGTQSLHTNSYDETLALPTDQAVTVALRTQQIIAEETGVTNTVDPLAGSFFVEALTNQMEEQALAYFEKIDGMGGMLAAIRQGFPQTEIADAAYRYQRQLDAGVKTLVGVNRYMAEEKALIETLKIDEKLEAEQTARLREVKRTRDNREVTQALNEIRRACSEGRNVMPHVIEAVKAYATEQEICDVYRDVFGRYQDPGFF